MNYDTDAQSTFGGPEAKSNKKQEQNWFFNLKSSGGGGLKSPQCSYFAFIIKKKLFRATST